MKDFSRDNFTIYKKADLLDYAKCPIRGEIFLPSYKPEEKIRLALIYFITGNDKIYPSLIDLAVESERLDISVYNNSLGEIAQYQPPAVIIETKREEFELVDAYKQLVNYLKSLKTESGLLFNADQAFAVEKKIDGYSCLELHEPGDIINFILSSVSKQSQQLLQETEQYNKAKNGDFQCFKILASKHRRSKRTIFKILQKEIEYTIEGHLFDFNPDCIKYTRCGYDTKSENKPSFLESEFLCLEGIFRF